MKFYYFNSTHWDREWYQPFQEFRKYLVDTTRVLLEIFERDPDYRRFTFDGQTIVLEDICEIRPDWRPKLEALIREQGKAELTCQFCDQAYHYSREALEALLASL